MEIPFPGTKGRIVESALNLFAQHGYRGVSVRDIAREVGIKDSSIYSHFSSKDDLLDAIIVHFRQVFLVTNPPVENLGEVMEHYGPEAFFRRGFRHFQENLADPVVARTYLVLMRERHDDNRAAEAWRRFEALVTDYAAQAFRVMVARKMVVSAEPKALAALFQTPIFHLIEEYVPLVCRSADLTEIESRIDGHFQFFFGLVVEASHG